MTVRLNVVVVQASHLTSLQAGVTAELVFQLLGVAGMDVAIVSSLDPQLSTATDRMMVQALASDLAVVDWCGGEETLNKLAALGVQALAAPHALDESRPLVPLGQRRAYLFDLRRGDGASRIAQTLKQLLSQRQVAAIPLSSLAGPVNRNKGVDSRSRSHAERPESESHARTPESKATTARVTKPDREDTSGGVPTKRNHEGSRHPDYRISDAELDDLVDGFNRIDL